MFAWTYWRYGMPETLATMRPRIANPKFEYSYAVPGAVENGMPARHHRAHLRVGGGQLAIAPRVVFGESLGMRQQVPDGEARRIGGRVDEARQLGDVARGRIVERELPLVAQAHDAERREALRHRRDAKHRVGVHRRLPADVAVAHGARVRQPAVDDDAVGDAGYAGPLGECLEEAVNLREGGFQLRDALRVREGGRGHAIRRRRQRLRGEPPRPQSPPRTAQQPPPPPSVMDSSSRWGQSSGSDPARSVIEEVGKAQELLDAREQ